MLTPLLVRVAEWRNQQTYRKAGPVAAEDPETLRAEVRDNDYAQINRLVRIRGMRRMNDAGEADNWADDIIVLDDD